MSLRYDLTKISNRDESEEGWRVTESIIFGCMITDIGTITEENHEEWFARFKVINPTTSRTLKEVHDHVGLSTNVVNRSRLQWCKGILANHMEIIIRDHKRWHQPITGTHQASCSVTRGDACDCAYKEENQRV